jgi:hypothetical protein
LYQLSDGAYCYVTIPASWSRIQFKITPDAIFVRYKFGGNAWSEFRKFEN